jgi:putative flippase GtrA
VRFLRFNAVGVLGFAVQAAVLALLARAGAHYLVATAVAVEAAVLHNFAWHERWTWIDRPAHGRARLVRLVQFHLLNGAVSMTGNLLLMRVLVGGAHLPPLPANLVAATTCAAINYAIAAHHIFGSLILDPSSANPASRIPHRESRILNPIPNRESALGSGIDPGFAMQDPGFGMQDSRMKD